MGLTHLSWVLSSTPCWQAWQVCLFPSDIWTTPRPTVQYIYTGIATHSPMQPADCLHPFILMTTQALENCRECLKYHCILYHSFQCYIHPKQKDTNISGNHLNPVMLVFIAWIALTLTLRWVPMCQGFNHFSFRFFASFCIGQVSH